LDLGIQNRLALVTGASRGIGRAIAAELAREGARLLLVARDAGQLEVARREFDNPDHHRCVAVDLVADGAVDTVVEAAAGFGDIDIIVHNLGGSARVFQTLMSSADWSNVWKLNVGVGHDLNRVFIPMMAERGWGRVVHISSLAATSHKGYAAYASAKCALDGYVKSVNRQFSKDNVIISAVAPGAIYTEGRYFAKLEKEDPAALERYFDTDLPIRRLGRAEEVAPVVAFLCSEKASFMAGSIVSVDGGGM
jgi:NAD(P)-dependent dehydrogenase (short-subunit alcohol dehydrogenase family)